MRVCNRVEEVKHIKKRKGNSEEQGRKLEDEGKDEGWIPNMWQVPLQTHENVNWKPWFQLGLVHWVVWIRQNCTFLRELFSCKNLNYIILVRFCQSQEKAGVILLLKSKGYVGPSLWVFLFCPFSSSRNSRLGAQSWKSSCTAWLAWFLLEMPLVRGLSSTARMGGAEITAIK